MATVVAFAAVGFSGVVAVEVPEPGTFVVDNGLSLDANGDCVGDVTTAYRNRAVEHPYRWDFRVNPDCSVSSDWNWGHDDEGNPLPVVLYAQARAIFYDVLEGTGGPLRHTAGGELHVLPASCPDAVPASGYAVTFVPAWTISSFGGASGCEVSWGGHARDSVPFEQVHERFFTSMDNRFTQYCQKGIRYQMNPGLALEWTYKNRCGVYEAGVDESVIVWVPDSSIDIPDTPVQTEQFTEIQWGGT